MAHVIDMHQLTKDPERLQARRTETPSSPKQNRPGRAREAVPGPLHLPPRRQPQRAADAAAGRRRARRRRPQLVHRVPRAARCSPRPRAQAGAPLPVIVMHDVLWPYGRRDLYYVPERVPEEFRQPYEMKGIRPGTKQVLPTGGLNPDALQRRDRRRPAQRRDDRARRLHRRVRPAAAPARAARVLRARDRGRGSAARARPGARRAARLLRDRRGQGHPARDRGATPPPGDPLPAQRLLRPPRPASTRGADRYLDLLEGRAARRALPRPRAPPPVPRRAASSRASAPTGRSSATRSARCSSSGRSSSRSGAAGALPDARPRRLDASRTPTWAASGSSTCGARSTPCATEAVAGDLVECGTGPRRRRDLHARLPRGPRDADRAGVGRRPVPASSRATRDELGRSRGPTSTRCATASPASACSTSASGSCRARPPTRSPTRRSSRSRCCASAHGAADDVGDVARRALRPRRRRRHRDRRRLRPTAGAASGRRRSARARRSPRRSSASTAPASRGARRAARRTVATGRGRTLEQSRLPARAAAPPLAPPAPATDARTSRSSSSSTTCSAKRRARCTRSRARTSRASTTSTTRSSSSRTARAPTRSSARSSCGASAPSSATSTSATDATPSPVDALNRGIARSRPGRRSRS